MSISDYAELKILDHALGTAAWTMPTGCFVKLHIGDPGEAGTGNPAGETTRQAVTFAAAAGGAAASNADVDWTSVSTTETYTHISLWDNVSAGNHIWYGALTASVAVTAGDNAKIPSGSLTVSLD